MLELLEEDNWFYSLERDTETGELFLEAVCGTVAIFTIRVKLDTAEIAAYEADASSIRALAYKIVDRPQDYIERAIRQNDQSRKL
ncbi:MAG: hypothetical protein IPM59_10900 [Chloracidobacterium sp.]|nr:hypothetical protein [Chloracidobacterium sp.]